MTEGPTESNGGAGEHSDTSLEGERAYVIRHEERVAGTDTAGWRGVGHVRARKRIDRVRVDEMLARDVEQIEGMRVPVDEGDSGRVEHLPDGSISIPLFEEELVVTKRVVLRERMIVRKSVETQRQRVREELRKERVELDADEPVRDLVQGLPGRAESGRRPRRRSAPPPGALRAETRPAFLTSELLALLLVAAGLGIAAAMDDAIDAPLFLVLLTVSVGFYAVARGAAKAHTASWGHDPREELLSRGRGRR